jgi:hypothetical protein
MSLSIHRDLGSYINEVFNLNMKFGGMRMVEENVIVLEQFQAGERLAGVGKPSLGFGTYRPPAVVGEKVTTGVCANDPIVFRESLAVRRQ